MATPREALAALDAKRTRLLGEINTLNGVATERDYMNYARLMKAVGKTALDDGHPEWFADYKAMLNERLVALENEAEQLREQCREDSTDSWYIPRLRRLTKPVAAVLAVFGVGTGGVVLNGGTETEPPAGEYGTRIAVLESNMADVRSDLAEVKGDMRELRAMVAQWARRNSSNTAPGRSRYTTREADAGAVEAPITTAAGRAAAFDQAN